MSAPRTIVVLGGGVGGPEMSGAVKQLPEARGIPYHPEHQVMAPR